MSIKFLKKASEISKGPASLKKLLHDYLSGYEKGRSLKTLHASELTKDEFCPRFYALSDLLRSKPYDRWLSTSEAVTFRMGRRLQEDVVNDLAAMNKLVGDWKCHGCGKLFRFQGRPAKCTECFCRAFAAEEVRFVSEVSGASCGVDALVNFGGGKLVPIEIKTMDKDQFKALVAPLAEHKLRTALYLRIIAESVEAKSNMVDTSKAIVFYVSKGGYGCADPTLAEMGLKEKFSPFKEFVVVRDDDRTEPLTVSAKTVYDFRQGKAGVPKGICATAMDKVATKCPRRTACFSGDYPAGAMMKVDDE